MATAVLDKKLTSHLNSMSSNFKTSMDEYLQYEKGSLLRNRYRFMRNLQAGSFGKVTCALDTTNNTRVAIKAMKRSIPGVRFMARHEISVMNRLGYHPNICQLIESFETRKYIVLVLEYIPGGDLYDAIHNHTKMGLTLQEDPEWFAQMCSQLIDVIKFSQSKSIYHRDIKPENVLLMEDGSVKLCDWGLATSAVNCKDFNVGTEKYMAPEALGEHKPSETYNSKLADAWSLGITLLYTLFGKCPFRKALQSDANYRRFQKSPEFMYDLYPNLSTSGFDAIVNKLMIERDLGSGFETALASAMMKGFTVDQEYNYEVLQTSSSEKKNSDLSEENSLGREFYMFDQEQPAVDADAMDRHDYSHIKYDEIPQEDLQSAEYGVPITVDSLSKSKNLASVASSSYMHGGNSLFEPHPSTSLVNSFDNTVPEESYIDLAGKRPSNKVDIDGYVNRFESFMRKQDQQFTGRSLMRER